VIALFRENQFNAKMIFNLFFEFFFCHVRGDCCETLDRIDLKRPSLLPVRKEPEPPERSSGNLHATLPVQSFL
jgi:hypothetical protein